MAQDKKPGRPAAKKAAPAKKAARKTSKPARKAPARKRVAAPAVEVPAPQESAPAPVEGQGQAAPATPEVYGPAMAKLNERQRAFVVQYLVDLNATQAAIRAGYSPKTANEQGSQLLAKLSVAAAVKEEQDARLKRLKIDGDDVVRRWHQQVFANPNELTQHRRVCCRHCWGDAFNYQYTPGEFKAARLQHEARRAEIKGKNGPDIGDFPAVEGDWYDKRREPHQDCPECFGEGEPEVWFADTRNLSPAALALYAGVKVGKDGIEVKTLDQHKASEMLGRHLGLFQDKLEVSTATPNLEALEATFGEAMRRARERQQAVNQTREQSD